MRTGAVSTGLSMEVFAFGSRPAFRQVLLPGFVPAVSADGRRAVWALAGELFGRDEAALDTMPRTGPTSKVFMKDVEVKRCV